MINRIVLVGRLIRDPEVKYTQSGIAVANCCIAVERSFKSADGKKETDFINFVAWKKLAELLGQYCKKGKMIGVDGSLQMRKYQTREGENRTSYEVVVENLQFLDSGKGGDNNYPAQSEPRNYENSTPPPSNHEEGDDELPF